MSYSFESAMERCEEAITKDEKCLNAMKEYSKASKAFYNSLSPVQQKEYLEFETKIEARISCQMLAVYFGSHSEVKTG